MTASDKGLLKDIYASVVFLTRFPAPGWPEAAGRPLAAGMWAFPVAGVLVATVGGAIYILCDLLELPVFVAALFATVAMIVTTGGRAGPDLRIAEIGEIGVVHLQITTTTRREITDLGRVG